MSPNCCRILLVEDNPDDATLLRSTLSASSHGSIDLLHVERLADALQHLGAKDETKIFDVILLDLDLPDSYGLDTLLTVHREAVGVPIVVLTGLSDEAIAEQVVRSGGQDYLVKGEVDGALVMRSIRYAIERQTLMGQLEDALRGQAREREFEILERLSGPSRDSVTAQLFGMAPLSGSAPDVFQRFVQNYQDLADLALEQQIYRVNHRLSEKLRSIAEELGFLRAGPKDVMEIHTAALKEKIRGATSEKAQAYMEEGRMMVLELMGDLVQFYRHYYLGTGRNT